MGSGKGEGCGERTEENKEGGDSLKPKVLSFKCDVFLECWFFFFFQKEQCVSFVNDFFMLKSCLSRKEIFFAGPCSVDFRYKDAQQYFFAISIPSSTFSLFVPAASGIWRLTTFQPGQR